MHDLDGATANFTGLVIGCIEAKFCKKICVGKLSPRSTQWTPLHRLESQVIRSLPAKEAGEESRRTSGGPKNASEALCRKKKGAENERDRKRAQRGQLRSRTTYVFFLIVSNFWLIFGKL